jgi:hypothetical protein
MSVKVKKTLYAPSFFNDKLLPSYLLFHPVLFPSYIIGDSYLSLQLAYQLQAYLTLGT